jgi:hypothetical protein
MPVERSDSTSERLENEYKGKVSHGTARALLVRRRMVGRAHLATDDYALHCCASRPNWYTTGGRCLDRAHLTGVAHSVLRGTRL